MHLRRFILLLLSSCAGQCFAASVVYSYGANGETTGILGVTGISQESSWRCRGSPASICECPTQIYQGAIAKVDYRAGSAIADGFVLEAGSGAEYVGLGEGWDIDLGSAASSWVPKLLRRGENVLVVVELCGASGRNVVARDVFSRRMLERSRGNGR